MEIFQFEEPLVEARLLKRYKRFLADAVMSTGEEVTTHCANPGSMKGLLPQGGRVYLSRNTNPKAKLGWRWEMVDIEGTLVGINTSRANALAEAVIKANLVEDFMGYDTLKREVKYGTNSRIDILLQDSRGVKADCFVEVKSVTMRVGDQAQFPDSKTARGAKHLAELSEMRNQGYRSVMLYLVQRDDCQSFDLANEIDPVYARAFDEAMARGVESVVVETSLSPTGISFTRLLPFRR